MNHDRCTHSDVGIEITGADADKLLGPLDEYLAIFAKPVRDANRRGNLLFGGIKCLQCDSSLNGALGTFEWGFVSGEGTCGKCGWPGRAHHRPKDEEGEIFEGTLEFVLQYHPDQVAKRKETA